MNHKPTNHVHNNPMLSYLFALCGILFTILSKTRSAFLCAPDCVFSFDKSESYTECISSQLLIPKTHWSPSYHICLLKFYFWVLLSERMSMKQGCREINAVFLQPSPSSAGKNVKATSGMKWWAAWNLLMHFVFITWNASLLTLIPFHLVQSVDRKR